MGSPLRPLRRAASAAVGGALVAATLTVAAPAPHAQAAVDPTPADIGAAWLESQLTEGLIVGQFGKEYGTSADAAIALDAVGGHDAAVTTISDAVAAEIDNYLDYQYDWGGSSYSGTSAGSTAKAAVLAQVAGANPTAFGGRDLISGLTGMVADQAPITGRIEDAAFVNGQPDPTGDYANTFGQTYAARALLTAAPADATTDTVVDYLLDQQCAAGFFRLYFAPKSSPDQTCDGASPAEQVPAVDTSAFVVIQLHAMAETNPEIAAAVDEAVAWILTQQAPDGSFDAGTATEGPNANSTGLAGWALHLAGETAAAARAATWIRARQVPGLACDGQLATEGGAIAYDMAAYQAGAADGITDGTAGQWRFAAIQALPALLAAPDSADLLSIRLPRFVDGGGKASAALAGVAPGERACVQYGQRHKSVVGRSNGDPVTSSLSLPDRTGEVSFRLRTRGGTVSDNAVVLGSKTLPLTLKSEVRRGRAQKVVVSGLYPGERVKVLHDGDEVASGKAAADRTFVATFAVGRRLGKHTVKVVGHFGDRRNVKTFRVVG